MKITPVKTHKITPKDTDILRIVNRYLPILGDRTVVAVTSKIVAICEGRVVPIPEGEKEKNKLKDKLIIQEAERYLPRSSSRYNVLLTVKGNAINFSSGVDESNSGGYFVLWPKDSQKSANIIRAHLVEKHKKKNVGVIITDTTSVPLRWGQRGVFVLAHSGFAALNSYIGKPDLFGRPFKMTSAAIADALGTAAVLVMGEGAEQTPLAVIEDIPFVKFQRRNPTKRELDKLRMPLEHDLYAPLLKAVQWHKGGRGYKKRVVVFGTFDKIHEGHRNFFRQAKHYGDELIMIVTPDRVVEKLKGKRPRYHETIRRAFVWKEDVADMVMLGDAELSSYQIIEKLKPDVICLGYDQSALEKDLKGWVKRKKLLIPLIRLKPYEPHIHHNSLKK